MLIVILRIIIGVAAVVLFAFFVAPMSRNIINPGNIAGAALCLCVLAMCISPVASAINGLFAKSAVTKILFRIVNIACAAFVAYGLAVTALIAFTGISKPSDNATVIVLGSQVRPSGEPSEILRGRITAAEKFLNEHPESVAVLSGGKGSDEIKSEARCMYEVMTADGIAPERLYMEDRSTDTAENFRFSAEIIEKNNLNPDIAVVTDGFHQFRAGLIAKKQGIDAQTGSVNADTNPLYVPTYVVREWFALPLLLIK